MCASNHHLTDREILQAIDRELTEFQLAAVDRHLGECETCRARRAALASAAAASAADYRSMSSDPLTARSRARLEATLAREAVTPRRSWLALTPVVAMAAVVVLAATASIYLQGTPATNAFAANHRLALPVASITPGATWDVSLEELCSGAPRVRPITDAMRAQVVSAYGVENIAPDQYELDYLVTPELGGATDARNLWPQKYASPIWNARVKDELERLLPQLVCNHQLDLPTAQRDMASDWIAAYKKYFNTDAPLEAHRRPSNDDDDDDVYLLADVGPTPAVRLVSFTATP
jgi:anti-sigma factor RsiW